MKVVDASEDRSVVVVPLQTMLMLVKSLSGMLLAEDQFRVT